MRSWVMGIMDAHAALRCPGGRFLVHEPPFAAIAIVVQGAQVSIGAGRLRGSRKSTDVRALHHHSGPLTCPRRQGNVGDGSVIQAADTWMLARDCSRSSGAWRSS